MLFHRSLIYFAWLNLWLVVSFHSTRLAQAQTSTGELSVTVLDATGASVPNATSASSFHYRVESLELGPRIGSGELPMHTLVRFIAFPLPGSDLVP